ncbi:hypothetical protein N7456_012969 [Penicillium angulare]|uniref:Uncharacterized protein n=1 Tax=Penicillium angulare TaxID=116970 RepID=A0A9W9EKM6_9EURO|nr:hypothetical protein N7456_012969 [Penicillium angulare]
MFSSPMDAFWAYTERKNANPDNQLMSRVRREPFHYGKHIAGFDRFGTYQVIDCNLDTEGNWVCKHEYDHDPLVHAWHTWFKNDSHYFQFPDGSQRWFNKWKGWTRKYKLGEKTDWPNPQSPCVSGVNLPPRWWVEQHRLQVSEAQSKTKSHLSPIILITNEYTVLDNLADRLDEECEDIADRLDEAREESLADRLDQERERYDQNRGFAVPTLPLPPGGGDELQDSYDELDEDDEISELDEYEFCQGLERGRHNRSRGSTIQTLPLPPRGRNVSQDPDSEVDEDDESSELDEYEFYEGRERASHNRSRGSAERTLPLPPGRGEELQDPGDGLEEDNGSSEIDEYEDDDEREEEDATSVLRAEYRSSKPAGSSQNAICHNTAEQDIGTGLVSSSEGPDSAAGEQSQSRNGCSSSKLNRYSDKKRGIETLTDSEAENPPKKARQKTFSHLKAQKVAECQPETFQNDSQEEPSPEPETARLKPRKKKSKRKAQKDIEDQPEASQNNDQEEASPEPETDRLKPRKKKSKRKAQRDTEEQPETSQNDNQEGVHETRPTEPQSEPAQKKSRRNKSRTLPKLNRS